MGASEEATLVIICLTFASILLIIFGAGCCCMPCFYDGPLGVKIKTSLIYLLTPNQPKPNMVVDLESQSVNVRSSVHPDDNVSNIALNSFPLDTPAVSSSSPQNKTGVAESMSQDSSNPRAINNSAEDSSDFKSVVDNFDRGSAKVTEHRLRRMSTIQIKRDNNNVMGTVIARPSNSQQSQISEQYDTFSRTLMLQKLIQSQMNQDEFAIRQVKDPFSDSYISVGGIVVVVKPFRGTNDYEFASLQTGDLLRIIKFYFHESKDDDGSIKSIQIANKTKSGEYNSVPEEIDEGTPTLDGYNQDICIDQTDINHANIYCAGILLNTYLDYNIISYP
ncbi:hypothetical protein JA1_000854 [Spathaspora sp. JA1]|nr:hypothetical protein JA1_000854 [Spathaspora sp. JA1]